MADYLDQCNTGEIKAPDPKSFMDIWCARCRKQDCDLAKWKNDLMGHRVSIWRERYFEVPQANIEVPRFAQIAELDFPNLIRKAMQMEISQRRGDWSVPEIPVLDGRIVQADPEANAQLEAAVRRLSKAQGFDVPTNPNLLELCDDEPPVDVEEAVEPGEIDEPVWEEEEEVEQEVPLPKPQPHMPQPRPKRTGQRQGNVSGAGEQMIGGGSIPPAAPEVDPWAPKKTPTIRVIQPGARIQFGGGGSIKDIKE